MLIYVTKDVQHVHPSLEAEVLPSDEYCSVNHARVLLQLQTPLRQTCILEGTALARYLNAAMIVVQVPQNDDSSCMP